MKMRFFKLTFLVLCFLLVFGTQAHAFSIAPGVEVLTGTSGPGVPAILDDINNQIDPDLGPELYKMDVGGSSDEGPLAGSYETSFANTPTDPEEATIVWQEGTAYVDTTDPAYLLVKDGNHDPVWYLFSLSALGWNGMDTLELSGFWPDKGAISHVSLYGTSNPVPEPATMLLFGVGLCGLAFVGRKKLIKQG